MLAHFGMNLGSFLRRQSALRTAAVQAQSSSSAKGTSRTPASVGTARLSSYTLEPRAMPGLGSRRCWSATICAAFFGYIVATPVAPENGFDLKAFSQLPVNFGGRAMPLDTLAPST